MSHESKLNPGYRRRAAIVLLLILAGSAAVLYWGETRLSGNFGIRIFGDHETPLQAAYSRGDWEQTSVLARQRLKEVPNDVDALRLAARSAAHQDRDQGAISIYSQLRVEDLAGTDFFLLGRALNRTGQNEAAFKALEESRKANPDHPETLEALARLYLQNDRPDAARELAERLAMQLGWETRALLLLSSAHSELNSPGAAAQVLGRFFELDPEGRSAAPYPLNPFRKLLARSLLQVGRGLEARAILQQLLASGPDDESTWMLSRSFLQEGDPARASEVLKRIPSYRIEHPTDLEPSPYVGSAACSECHQPIYRDVLASKHASTFARPAHLRDLPLPANPLPDPGQPDVVHEFHWKGDSLHVETRAQRDMIWRAVVDYAFGSREHFMSFVGRDEQDVWRTIRMSHFDSPRGSGWDVATGLPLHPERDDEFLGKKMVGRDGVRRCLFCHTTNFRAILDQSGPEAADHSIGCEACHGPGGNHVAAVDAGLADMAIATPAKTPGSKIDKLCGQCHSMHNTSVVSAPRTDPVWYRFQSLTMAWTRCFTESDGKLSCVTCHDPHRDAETSAASNEAKCLSCHTPGGGNEPAGKKALATAKTRCPINPTQGCIGCHMPRAWIESTHSFKTDHYIRVRDQSSPSSR